MSKKSKSQQFGTFTTNGVQYYGHTLLREPRKNAIIINMKTENVSNIP